MYLNHDREETLSRKKIVQSSLGNVNIFDKINVWIYFISFDDWPNLLVDLFLTQSHS